MAGVPPEATKYKPENRERCRRVLVGTLEAALRNDKKVISVEKLVDAGARDRNATTTLLRLWRSGVLTVADSWGDEGPTAKGAAKPDDADEDRARLMERIRAASSDRDREEIAHELAALVAGQAVAPDEAAQIRAALAEARNAAEKKRAVEPAPEVERAVLAGPEAYDLIAAYEGIVSDQRRAEVLRYVLAQLEVDKAEHPNACRPWDEA